MKIKKGIVPLSHETSIRFIYRLFIEQYRQYGDHRLARLPNGDLSHDKISRLLYENDFWSKDLRHHVKPQGRSHETGEACPIFGSTAIDKPYMDESDDISCTGITVRAGMKRELARRLHFITVSCLM